MDFSTFDPMAFCSAVVGLLAIFAGFELAWAAIERITRGSADDGGVD